MYGELSLWIEWEHDSVVTLEGGGAVTHALNNYATGAAYRRLGIEALEAYTGLGVFYGAATSEAQRG